MYSRTYRLKFFEMKVEGDLLH